MSDINKLLNSNECSVILKKIAKENDLRMCLNRDVMKRYRTFFADVIMLNFVFDVLPIDLKDIYEDVEKFTKQKCIDTLKANRLDVNPVHFENLFNEILGDKQYVFHGTTSLQEENIKNMQNCVKFVKPYLETINEIYENHGIFLAFQGGIKDFNANNFWATPSVSSACFYALQSPEFFARFASRSDYYKTDIFKYDRIAYYRKDYKSCVKNLLTEMKEFSFSKNEKHIVLINFKKMWDNIVKPDMQSIILYTENPIHNKQHFKENISPYQMLLKHFTKIHFTYDIKEFNKNTIKIALPDVKQYLKRQQPKIDKKFILFGGRKIFPDFYIDHKYANRSYYGFDEKNNIVNLESGELVDNKHDLVNFINLAKPNSKKAKKFMAQKILPDINDVIEYYREEFENCLKAIRKQKNQKDKIVIMQKIADDTGLKFVASKKYHKFFKDIGQFEIYELRKYLGIKLFEHYDGFVKITDEKINNLLNLYKRILKSPQTCLSENIPLKILRNQIEIVK